MHLRDARHEVLAGAVDLRRAGGDLDVSGRPQGHDPVTLYDHGVIGQDAFGVHRDY